MDWTVLIEEYGLVGLIIGLLAREASAWVRQTRGTVKTMATQVSDIHRRVPASNVTAVDRQRLEEIHRFVSTEDPDGQRVSVIRQLNNETLREVLTALSRAFEQQTAILERMDDRDTRAEELLSEIHQHLTGRNP